MSNPDPQQPGGALQHTPAPPATPGLGGPGYSAHGGYTPVAQPGLAAPVNRPGLVSVILGGVGLMVDLGFVFVQVGLIAGHAFSVFDAVALLRGALIGLLAIAAVIVGGMGLARRDAPKALAGIGVGIGIALLVDLLATGIYAALVAVVSR